MKIGKIFGWTALSIGILVIVLIATVAVAMKFGITINLDGIRSKVDAAATKALGREVAIDGSVELLVSFQPGLEINGVRIGNPVGWPKGNLIFAERVRGDIDIIPLLRGKIQIGEIRADGLLLSLETTASGKNNWEFDVSGKSQPVDTEIPADNSTRFSVDFVELRELALYGVVVTYRDGGLNKRYKFRIDALDGTAAAGESMFFNIWGSFQKTPFNFSLQGDPFEELLNPTDLWKLLLSGKIGESPIQVEGSFHPQGQASEASLQVNVESVSMGGLLKEFGISDSMEVDLDRFSIEIDARGGNFKEIIEQSNFSATLENGHWFWPDPQNKLNMDFEIIKGVIQSPAGKPIELGLEGLIQENQFTLSLKGDPFTELALTKNPWNMQLTAKFPNSQIRGNAQMVRQAEIPEVVYELVSENVNLGEMLKRLGIAEGINAKIDKMRLNISARGRNPRELIELSEARIALENSRYVQSIISREEDLTFLLTQGTIHLPPKKPLKMDIGGKLDRHPYSVIITGGTLESLLLEEKSWAIDISGKFAHAPMQAKVTWVRPTDTPEARIDIETGKIEIGDLLDWLGIARGIKANVGSMQVAAIARGSNQPDLLAKSDFEYTLKDGHWSLENPNMRSNVDVVIHEFKVKRPAGNPIALNMTGHLAKVPGEKKELPVKFEIQATAQQKIPTGSNAGKAAGPVNRLYELDVNSTIGDSGMTLTGSLDQSRDMPVANLDLKTGPLNIGSILSWLEIVQGMDAIVGGFDMHIDARGDKIEEVLSQSNLSASIRNGLWTLRDPNTQASAKIGIRKGTIQSLAGKPITFTLDGSLKETPININIHTETLAAFAREIDRLPLSFEVQAAGTRLNLAAEVVLPVSGKTMDFQMALRGETLNSLDELLDVSLPPIGPYSLGGQLGIDEKGYRVSGFEVHVGQSDLTGNAVLTTTGAKPDLYIELATKTLQFDDFDFGEWSAIEPETQPTKRGEIAREDVKTILSPAVMQSLDARFALNVSEVYSGRDSLGGGAVIAALKNGRLTVDPLRLDIPGGAVDVSLAYEPTGKGVLAKASAYIDKFDFGVLARRAKANSKMKGLISLDVDLISRAPSLDVIMHNANGHIDFGVWPEDLESGIIDLWAVNLFTAILPQVDKEESSKVNCIIGQYSLKDGLLREDRMVIDTTRMRVKGEARVDFKKEEVYLYLKSSGKRPEFFSLATPIEVKGKISDFNIGAAPGGLIGTSIRLITSPLHVPLRRLFSENLPSEGKDVCQSPVKRNN